MSIRKLDNGRWEVNIRPDGRKQIRKWFSTRKEAERFAAWTQREHDEEKEWEPKKKERKRLSQLVATWYEVHGRHLKDGARRRNKLDAIVTSLGDPWAHRLTAADWTAYRSRRLTEGASPSTVNHDHAYLRAVYHELKRLGHWSDPIPIDGIRRLKVDEQELTFLTLEQIAKLLNTLRQGRNTSTYHVARCCLATGARWSEAERLQPHQILPDRITFAKTKNGRSRTIPIDPSLAHTLQAALPFRPCYSSFREAVERAAITLPAGQLTHVLRHSFASHFMQGGGNILTLQRLLGHASLTMTMRYAHLSPDHLEDARRLNPLAKLGENWENEDESTKVPSNNQT